MPTHHRPRTCRALCALLALTSIPVVAACSGDDDLASSSFCDEVRSRADAFVAEGANEVPPTLIGALREVVDDGDAPDELRDAYNGLTEASGDDDLDEALADIRQVVARCGVEMSG